MTASKMSILFLTAPTPASCSATSNAFSMHSASLSNVCKPAPPPPHHQHPVTTHGGVHAPFLSDMVVFAGPPKAEPKAEAATSPAVDPGSQFLPPLPQAGLAQPEPSASSVSAKRCRPTTPVWPPPAPPPTYVPIPGLHEDDDNDTTPATSPTSTAGSLTPRTASPAVWSSDADDAVPRSRGVPHQRRGRRPRPFGCERCGRAFSKREHLRRHDQLIHKKLRPYKCVPCNAWFGTKQNMNTHMSTKKHQYRQLEHNALGL